MRMSGKILAGIMALMMLFGAAWAEETAPAAETPVEEAVEARFSGGYARVSGKLYKNGSLSELFGTVSGSVIWVTSRSETEDPGSDVITAKIAWNDEIHTVYTKARNISPIEDQAGYEASAGGGISLSGSVKLMNANVTLPEEEKPAETEVAQPEAVEELQPEAVVEPEPEPEAQEEASQPVEAVEPEPEVQEEASQPVEAVEPEPEVIDEAPQPEVVAEPEPVVVEEPQPEPEPEAEVKEEAPQPEAAAAPEPEVKEEQVSEPEVKTEPEAEPEVNEEEAQPESEKEEVSEPEIVEESEPEPEAKKETVSPEKEEELLSEDEPDSEKESKEQEAVSERELIEGEPASEAEPVSEKLTEEEKTEEPVAEEEPAAEKEPAVEGIIIAEKSAVEEEKAVTEEVPEAAEPAAAENPAVVEEQASAEESVPAVEIIPAKETVPAEETIPAEEPVPEEAVEEEAPAALVMLAQPANASALIGDPVTLTVTAENAAGYQWQYSTDGQNWTDCENGTAAEYSFPMTAEDHGKLFRCVLKDLSGNSAASETAVVTLALGDFTVDEVTYSVIEGELPVTVLVKSYSGSASDLVIPEQPRVGYTVVYVGEGAFEGNLNLVSLDLPETVDNIGDRAFKGCRNLRVID